MTADETVAIERKQFGEQRTCIKCEGEEVKLRHVPAGRYPKPPGTTHQMMEMLVGQQETIEVPEYLNVTCKRCGFSWQEFTADADEPDLGVVT